MYKGSNAEKLHNMCLYDLLCSMQGNLEHCNKASLEPCIMDAIGLSITEAHYRHMKSNGDCNACVQAFLNEKYDGRW